VRGGWTAGLAAVSTAAERLAMTGLPTPGIGMAD